MSGEGTNDGPKAEKILPKKKVGSSASAIHTRSRGRGRKEKR